MDAVRSYYEQEARQRLRPATRSNRVALRDSFARLLTQEDRASVIDFGSGPGRDASAFTTAGIRFLGIDLAHGNGVLARTDEGVQVLQASVTAPPIRPRSFAAGWSMSTLMHLDDADFTTAVAAMVQCLEPGAPLQIGLWGASGDGAGSVRYDDRVHGQRRPFYLRTEQQVLAMIAPELDVVDSWFMDVDVDDQHYQVLLGRTPERTGP